MARVKNDYFAMLASLAEYPEKAATCLANILRNFDPDTLEEDKKAVHKIEHEADQEKHELMRRLAKEFITPIEREDIISLSGAIDDVTDAVEDILLHLYMFNIREIRPDVYKLVDLIEQACSNGKSMMNEFKNYKKSVQIHQMVVAMNRIESEGDTIYYDSVRRLYVEEKDPVKVMGWTRTFSHIEQCLDACEDLSDAVETAIMKNS